MSAVYTSLIAELDRWQEQGRRATLWWRDDDAVDLTGSLERLLGLAETAQVAPALAVIPLSATEALLDRLRCSPAVVVLVHGARHTNHAPAGEWQAELGLHRALPTILDELAAARERLQTLAGDLLRPYLVAPWHMLAPEVECQLPRAGFRGISSFGPRGPAHLGLWRLNTHVDIIDWDHFRLREPVTIIADLVAHLSRRRQVLAGLPAEPLCSDGQIAATPVVDGQEPTGLLSHHLVHGREVDNLLAGLLEVTTQHPAACWLGFDEAAACSCACNQAQETARI